MRFVLLNSSFFLSTMIIIMEQHPVPQNVTTFQFRLIGDMTIKQFGYLCAGAILAFIAYKLPLPLIVTWPLAGVLAFLGVGFAFIPVEERPMDVWVFSFFRSIYSPTQYIWSHGKPSGSGVTPRPQSPSVIVPSASHTLPPTTTPPVTPRIQERPAQPPTKTILSGIFHQLSANTTEPNAPPSSVAVPAPSTSIFDGLFTWFRPTHTTPRFAALPTSQPKSAIPSVVGYKPPPESTVSNSTNQTAETQTLQQKIIQLESTLKNLEERLTQKTVTEDRVLELQKNLTDVMKQKSQTEEELITLKRSTQPSTPPPPHDIPRGVVNVISTQEAAVKVGLPRLTNAPNVITGIIKDDDGNFLPGILVTVTNHEGVPVRALKANKLGQFAASTPLTNGTYFVEIEDPRQRFTFSRVQLTLNGGVVPVIEIIAKSEKVLNRERLAQELFGKQS